MSVLKNKYGPTFLNTSQLGAASGVAPLDSTGKLSSTYLPAGVTGGLNFKGSYDASTALPTSPSNGDFYIVSKAGTGGGVFSPALAIGDFFFYSSSASAWEPVYGPKTSDALTEGSTNLFFTAARAQAAAVQNSLAASTTIAPSASAVNTALAGYAVSFTRFKERFTLAAADVSNGYVTLSHAAQPLSVIAGVQGLGLLEEVTSGTLGDYAMSSYVAGTNSTLTWKNDLVSGGAAPLAAGDVIYVQYVY